MIMEIRRPTQAFECNFSAFKNDYGIIIYQRDKEKEEEKEFNCINFTKEDYLKINNYIQEKNNSETFENKILSLINNNALLQCNINHFIFLCSFYSLFFSHLASFPFPFK